MKRDYSDLFDLLTEIEEQLPKAWPEELPAEDAPGFWEQATRLEFAHRATLTRKIRHALEGDVRSFATFSPLEAWLYQRRMEWATQLVLEAAKQGAACTDSPRDFLLDVVAEHWHEHGAIAFWNHAMERDGKPHPEADEDILRAMNS